MDSVRRYLVLMIYGMPLYIVDTEFNNTRVREIRLKAWQGFNFCLYTRPYDQLLRNAPSLRLLYI